MESMVTVRCERCKKKFVRRKAEQKRNLKKGRKAYCSKMCATASVSRKNLGNFAGNNSYDISKHSGNQKDEFTGLREFIRRANSRTKEVSIDLPDLKLQWERQNGICAYSGVNLHYPRRGEKNNVLYTASLDRIDSSLGYIKDNIQFVSIAVNHAKGCMTHNEMIEFCRLVASNNK